MSENNISRINIERAQILWNYEVLNEPVRRNADAIVLLGSFDLYTARVAAGLVLSGFSDTLIICGGKDGWNCELLKSKDKGLSMAEILAKEVDKYNIEYELLKETKNTGEEIKSAYNLLKNRNNKSKYVIGVHMPSSERRDKATFQKQCPKLENVIMVSPRMTIEEYQQKGYMGLFPWRNFIEDLMGGFQRTFIYSRPEFGFQVPQTQMPEKSVLESYQHLLENGFTRSLVRKKNGEIYSVEDFCVANP